MKWRRTIILSFFLILLGFAVPLFIRNTQESPNFTEPPPAATAPPAAGQAEPAAYIDIAASDIPEAHEAFAFTASIPAGWEAEAIPATEAINIYDPNVPGDSNLEKSQIFIRHFNSDTFLTLSTVTIHTQEDIAINGRPAVRYDIEKNTSVPPFANQPSWRNERHIVTDIRVSDENPSTFYVIAKRPELAEDIYQQFLLDFAVQATSLDQSFIPPVTEFRQRITKKPFGIHITPETSPVQPERFSGYHTGVDVEYDDTPGQVPVVAIADGEVVLSRQASGYGGVVAMRHIMNNEAIIAVYGHLNPSSLPATGSSLRQGDRIGFLGEGHTAETDGERKHLHFALHRGTQPDLRGYVATEEELSFWLNPLEVII